MARRISNPEVARRFGRRLRRLRDATRQPQEWLADRVGVTPATISRFESGNLAPTLTTAEALARGLGIPLHELFRFDDGAEARPAEPGSVPGGARERDVEELVRTYQGLSPRNRRLALELLRALPSEG